MGHYARDKMCVCGHILDEHHWPCSECEWYGSNETGGAMPVHDDGTVCEPREWIRGVLYKEQVCQRDHKWVDHCLHFTPVAIPLGPVHEKV